MALRVRPAEKAHPATSCVRQRAAPAVGVRPSGPRRPHVSATRRRGWRSASSVGAGALGSTSTGVEAPHHSTAAPSDVWAETPTQLLPVLLHLQDVRATLVAAGESHAAGGALSELPTAAASAHGLAAWTSCLQRGALPTEHTFESTATTAFPCQPLRGALLATLTALQVAPFAERYPGVRSTLLHAVVSATVKYATLRRKHVLPDFVDTGSAAGDAGGATSGGGDDGADAAQVAEEQAFLQTDAYRQWAAQRAAADAAKRAAVKAERQQKAEEEGDVTTGGAPEDEHHAWLEASFADWQGDAHAVTAARTVCTELYTSWLAASKALRRAGSAFAGLDEVLGGPRGSFSVSDPGWSRGGWALLHKYSATLAECKELRDLVRRLGRGAGWGPLRLSPTQRWDDHGRDGLLRDPLEAAETRSLTRGGDVAMMLPAEASLYAKGRTLRAARLLFYARAAERALLSYARDGWAELPARDIAPWIREVRPTAERGPILLCLDSSGSMRGAREAVAKALALECMRAARVQERRCFCYAFSGPRQIEELELGSDPAGLGRLLTFMERSFNGGSDLNAPLGSCIQRLAQAEWANSDILVVSDGELRQPSAEVTRQIATAKADLGLRIHGLQLPVRGLQDLHAQ